MRKIFSIGLCAAAAATAGLFMACTHTTPHTMSSTTPKNGTVIPHTVLKKNAAGVEIRKGGLGSDACAYPGDNSKFYLITDRGPNVDYTGTAGKGKLFPIPDYNPEIGLFQIQQDGSVTLLHTIALKDPTGKKITGIPNPEGKGATGEIPYDENHTVLAFAEYGLDSEGLVAMKDGSFWVSDEYGPHIVHFSAEGVELERISPEGITTNGRKLPAVFAKRRANRGMEGLTKTPDEKYLIGIMQSTLYNPSKKAVVNDRLVRLVKFELATGKTWQYVYQQNKETSSCCGITALSNDEFIVIERDSNLAGETEAHKYIYRINLHDATDVNGDSKAEHGMIVHDKTLEQCTQAELEEAGIRMVKKELIADLVKDIGYDHEKLEGLWLLDNHTLCVVNDNDFAVTEKDNAMYQKILPGQDHPEDNVIYSITF